MRILGIDYGDRRIGLALSDEGATLCGRAWTLQEWDLDRAVERIAAAARENDAALLVLGLPKNMDGSEGPRAEKSRLVADRLRAATGLEVGSALEAADRLAQDGVSAEVINIHTIKPLDEEIILKSAAKTGRVVTAEEAFIAGGLGGAVAELLSAKLPTKLARIGVDDQFGESGPAVELLHKYRLDGEGVYEQVKAFLG